MRGGMNSCNTEVFKGSGNILYDTVMMDTCHYPFAQIHRMYKTKNEP